MDVMEKYIKDLPIQYWIHQYRQHEASFPPMLKGKDNRCRRCGELIGYSKHICEDVFDAEFCFYGS
jgi:hypothetical protein